MWGNLGPVLPGCQPRGADQFLFQLRREGSICGELGADGVSEPPADAAQQSPGLGPAGRLPCYRKISEVLRNLAATPRCPQQAGTSTPAALRLASDSRPLYHGLKPKTLAQYSLKPLFGFIVKRAHQLHANSLRPNTTEEKLLPRCLRTQIDPAKGFFFFASSPMVNPAPSS